MAGQNNSERNGRKVHMPIAKAGRSKIHGNSVQAVNKRELFPSRAH